MDFKVEQALSRSRIEGVTDPQSLKRLEQIDDQRLRAEAVAQQLESVFFGMMIKAMRQTVPDGGIDGKGLGRSQYMQMLDQQYAGLTGQPRDPRFHEALVRQILTEPGQAEKVLTRMEQQNSAEQAASRRSESIQTTEDQASKV